MPNNPFIWADLSTFDLKQAKQFYNRCFHWNYQQGDNYATCQPKQGGYTAGIYPMPEKFVKIGMPSFWMSYIQVDDINQTAALAKANGGRVEVEPTADQGGLISLIRDPSGAGFTCYQGEAIGAATRQNLHGQVCWNTLHVSNLDTVQPFYENVFGWHIKVNKQQQLFDVYLTASSNQVIANICVTDNSIKGDKEYWGVYFAVNDVQQTSQVIKQNGGETMQAETLGNTETMLAIDPSRAAFYLIKAQSNNQIKTAKAKHPFKWRAVAGMLLMTISFVTEISWILGLFFLYWVLPDIKSKTTYFMELVSYRSNPILYCIIIGVWIFLSVYMFVEELYPYLIN